MPAFCCSSQQLRYSCAIFTAPRAPSLVSVLILFHPFGLSHPLAKTSLPFLCSGFLCPPASSTLRHLCCWARSGFLFFTPNPWREFLLSLKYASSFPVSTDEQPEGSSQLIYSLFRCTHRIFVLHLFPLQPSSYLFPKRWLPQ